MPYNNALSTEDDYYWLLPSIKRIIIRKLNKLSLIPRKTYYLTFFSACYFVICMYLVSVANSSSDDLNPNSKLPSGRRQVLRDPVMHWLRLIFDRKPDIMHLNDYDFQSQFYESYLPSNTPDILIAISMVFWILRLSMMPSLTMGIALLRRTFWIAGTVYLIRAACILMTILPFPYVECEVDKRENTSSWIDAFNIMLLKRTSCGDVFYSGHCIVFMIAFLSWKTYNYSWITTLIAFLETLVGVLSLLIVSYHYSIDIIVSIFVTMTVWHLYHTALRIMETHSNMHKNMMKERCKINSTQVSEINEETIVNFDDEEYAEDLDHISIDSIEKCVKTTIRGEIRRIHGFWVIFFCLLDGQ